MVLIWYSGEDFGIISGRHDLPEPLTLNQLRRIVRRLLFAIVDDGEVHL